MVRLRLHAFDWIFLTGKFRGEESFFFLCRSNVNILRLWSLVYFAKED